MRNLRHLLAAGLLAFACVFAGCSDDDDDIDNPAITEQDRSFMMQASYGNWAEVSMGKLADSLSNDAGVKMFGQHMQTDHTTAQNELISIADGWNLDLPAGPDSAHFAMRLKMTTMAPEMFDTAYVKGQIVDHDKTIALFEHATTNSNQRLIREYAAKHLPTVKMHRAMIDTIAQRVMAR